MFIPIEHAFLMHFKTDRQWFYGGNNYPFHITIFADQSMYISIYFKLPNAASNYTQMACKYIKSLARTNVKS